MSVFDDSPIFAWDDDPAQHEPFMRCQACGQNLCSVEEGDTVGLLASVARDHDCPEGKE